MARQSPGMLSQQDQEMRRNVLDPPYAGGSHYCGSGAGHETTCETESNGDVIFANGCLFRVLLRVFNEH